MRLLHRLTAVGLALGAVLVAGWGTAATATEAVGRVPVPATTSLEREQAEEAAARAAAAVQRPPAPSGSSQTIVVTIGRPGT